MDFREEREKKLLSAAKEAEELKETEKNKVDALKEKYKEEGGKVYEVTTTVQVDVILVAVLSSCMFVVAQKPKEILSKMS